MPALLKTTQIQEPSSASVNLTLDTSGNGTFAGTSVMSSPYTMRNKIINGAMIIDQRNAGASVTPANGAYTLDRWAAVNSQSSKYSVQQSSTVPSGQGFSNSLFVTSLSSYSVGASDYFFMNQYVEGFNAVDLAWGTASALTVTLSFWVRSSLTGTFVVAIRSGGDDVAYPATYTINSANTWERKTITISGPTSGTFSTTNARAFGLWFSLGAGSNFNQTANTWGAGGALSVSGSQSVVGTNGATWYVTGVQLERGTVATPFEYRNYQQELAMCMRYYESSLPAGTAPSNGANTTTMVSNAVNITPVAAWGGTTPQNTNIRFAVPKRATPTMTTYGNSQGYWGYLTSGATLPTNQTTYTFSSSVNAQSADTNSLYVNQQASQSILWGVAGNWAASAEL